MYGLPADTVRRRFKTRVIPNNAINPVWDDETFVFKKVRGGAAVFCIDLCSVTVITRWSMVDWWMVIR